jgi:hypothetical protein
VNRFEYQVVQMAQGGRIGQFNERIAMMVAEGWDPIIMCGDGTLSIMLRRPVAAQAAAPAPPAPAQ